MSRHFAPRDLDPLLRVAAGDEDPDLRVMALRSLSRFALTEEGWRAAGSVARDLLDRIGEEDPLRGEVADVAAGIPLRSVRRRIRAMASDAGDPASDAAAMALARAGDPSVADVVLDAAERGVPGAVERLAGLPLERSAVTAEDVRPLLEDPDPTARFFASVALARLGDSRRVDAILRGDDARPAFLAGSPWGAYEKIAAARPLPDDLREHLLGRVPGLEAADDRGGLLIVWALTGVKDAEGRPVEPGGPPEGPTAPLPETGPEDVTVERPAPAVSARGVLEDPGLAGRCPPSRAGATAVEVLEAANRRVEETGSTLGEAGPVGNEVVDALRALAARATEWPVAELARAWFRAPRPAVDEAQIAWIVALAPPDRVLRELEGLLEEGTHDVDRDAVVSLLGEVGAVLAGRGGSPYRGAGSGEGGAPPGPMPLIDDEVAEAMTGGTEPVGMEERAAAGGGPSRDTPVYRRTGERPVRTSGEAPGEAEAAPGPVTVRRTPHLDVRGDEPLPPDTEVRVRVYADMEDLREGESGHPIVVEVPAGTESVDVDVHLQTSSHFALHGERRAVMTVPVDDPESGVVTFDLRVRSAETLAALRDRLDRPGEGRITAVFSHRGRPSGMVSRVVEVAVPGAPAPGGSVPEPPPPGAPEPSPALRVEPGAARPDLTVLVKVADDDQGHRLKYECRVASPHLDGGRPGDFEPWVLPRKAEELVVAHMDRFTTSGLPSLQRLAALRSAGRKLFDAAPANFRRAFWSLVDAGGPLRTIQVVSQEPYLPWELMIPHRHREEGGREERPPLGVEFAVGRWVSSSCTSGPQRIRLRESIIVAPEYEGADYLRHARAEAAFVKEHFEGTYVEPATFEGLHESLGSRRPGVVHLVCHGKADAPLQTVELEDEGTLTAGELGDILLDTGALRESRALAVVNACEVGRTAPALVGLEGFAPHLIQGGAGAVVAALWSVKDDLAHEVAITFYRSILDDPGRAFADIVREIRARAYDEEAGAEDTYAAYCFYGDPLASAEIGDG